MNYEFFSFGNPSWLWALLLLIPLVALFYHAKKERAQLLTRIMAPRLRETLIGSVSSWKRTLRISFLFLALASLIVALARPHLGFEEMKISSRSRDVMIAIDTSRSMLATDVAPTRLARAKLLAQDLLELLPGDRVGLIAFAGRAFLQAPLTLDHHAVRDSVEELDTSIIPKGGTDISDAIRAAEAAFGKEEETSRILVIMTDGEDLEEDAVAEARNAATQGIKIFTIGIGSPEGSLIPIKNENGQTDFVRDAQGKAVLSKLDVQRLEEIAQATGGFYVAFGADAARDIVQRGILPLQAGTTGNFSSRKPIERYQWPVGLALLLLLLWSLLNERRRRGIAIVAATSFLFLSSYGKAEPGINNYNQGNYQSALQDFEQRLQSGNAADEVRFDAGAAAYKKGDYKKAIEYFTGAMTSASSNIQQAATYNLANALVRSGEAEEDVSEKSSDWKNAIQHYDTVLKADPKNQNAKENREIVKKLLEDLKKNPPKQDQKKNDQQQNKNDQKNQQQQQSPSDKNDQKNADKNQQQQKNQQTPGANGSQDQKNNDQQQQKQNSQDKQQPTPTPSPNGTSTPSSDSKSNPNTGSIPSPTASPAATPSPTPSSSSGKNGEQNLPQPSPSSTSENSSPSPQQNNPGARSPQQTGGSTPQPTPGEKKNGDLSGGEQSLQTNATSAATAEEGTNGMSAKQAEALLRSMQEEEERVNLQQRHEQEETTRDW